MKISHREKNTSVDLDPSTSTDVTFLQLKVKELMFEKKNLEEELSEIKNKYNDLIVKNHEDSDDGVFAGGTAEHWYRSYEEVLTSKETLNRHMQGQYKQALNENESLRDAIKHKRCELAERNTTITVLESKISELVENPIGPQFQWPRFQDDAIAKLGDIVGPTSEDIITSIELTESAANVKVGNHTIQLEYGQKLDGTKLEDNIDFILQEAKTADLDSMEELKARVEKIYKKNEEIESE